jgi:cysteine desulfurase
MSRHYLDHASTSPSRPEVVEAMLPWLSGAGAADPARVHTEGRMARAGLEDARAAVAELAGVRPRQVIFTSGATEAANAAVWGALRAAGEERGRAVLCAAVEHSCVRDASALHGHVVPIAVDSMGRVLPEAVEQAVMQAVSDHGGVALVHCQWANHEVGTIQPVAQVAVIAHRLGALLHVDAAAAFGQLPTDLLGAGADLVSVSAHKLGGPKGIGALIVGRGLRVDPLVVGGDQERGRRAGMENVPAAIGFGVAARLAADGLQAQGARSRQLTDRVLSAVRSLGGTTSYGDPSERVPHIVCLGVDGVEAEAVVLGLDQAGIAVHSGSACSSESLEPSPVLEAMGVDADRSLRVSVGWSTTDDDVAAFEAALPQVVGRLRALRSG